MMGQGENRKVQAEARMYTDKKKTPLALGGVNKQ